MTSKDTYKDLCKIIYRQAIVYIVSQTYGMNTINYSMRTEKKTIEILTY